MVIYDGHFQVTQINFFGGTDAIDDISIKSSKCGD